MNRRFYLIEVALAAMVLGGCVHIVNSNRLNTSREVKAILEKGKRDIVVNSIDASDIDPIWYHVSNNNWVPKFGHPKRKTNKLRCKHNAKLKRR